MKTSSKMVLSFVFVLFTAFGTQYLVSQKIEKDNREVASYGERYSPEQIKWEQKVADELSKNNINTQMPLKPSWQDLLVYEFLSGRYDPTVNQGQIEKLVLQQSVEGVSFKTKDFVDKFGRKIKNFTDYKMSQVDPETEVVQLMDQNGQPAGSFTLKRDGAGRVQTIQIQ